MKTQCQECGALVEMAKAIVNKKVNGEWKPDHYVDICPICDTEQLVYAIEYAKYVKDTIQQTGRHPEE